MVVVDTQLSGNSLIVTITASNIDVPVKYACYLYHNDKVLIKSSYQDENVFTFPLNTDGTYQAYGFVMWRKQRGMGYERQSAEGNAVFFSPSAFQEYREFMQNSSDVALPKLPFAKLTYPKQDFLVAVSPADNPASQLDSLATQLSLNTRNIGPTAVILSELPLFQQGSNYVLFSGIGRTDDRLVVGMDDIDSCATAQAISGQVGCFCLLRAEGDNLTLETDYFGMDKLYYYWDRNVCLISSRVHLIILAMDELKISRRPSMARIYTSLSNLNITRQNFCQELNVEGLVALRADSRLNVNLSTGEIRVEKTGLHSMLSQSIPYSESSFRALLKQAADEIVDNLRIALEHPAFDRFVLQLTGGMDSRTVLCALSRLPQYKDKVIAKTVKTRLTGDFEVAMKLLSKFRLPFGDIPVKEGVPYNPDWQFEELSVQLGVTVEAGKSIDPEHLLPGDRTCLLSGCSGEALARCCYTSRYFNRILDNSVLSDRAYADQLFRFFRHRTSVFKAPEELYQTLILELMSLPGIDNLAKYENHYLFYRNGLHFNTAHDYQPFAPFWGALQSKALLQLKVMTTPQQFGNRLEMELIYELNPELGSVEYEAEKYNLLREQLDEQYHHFPRCTEFDEALIQELKQEWEECEQRRNLQVKPGADQPCKFNPFSLPNVLQILYILITRLNLRENAAIALYNYIKHQNTQDRNYLVRKLVSLYYELY